jgi:hypothetical protein
LSSARANVKSYSRPRSSGIGSTAHVSWGRIAQTHLWITPCWTGSRLRRMISCWR